MSWRFEMHRDVDVSGMSGQGHVASGIRLPFRLGVLMKWRTPTWSVVWYPRVEWVERVHGHDGHTRIVWK